MSAIDIYIMTEMLSGSIYNPAPPIPSNYNPPPDSPCLCLSSTMSHTSTKFHTTQTHPHLDTAIATCGLKINVCFTVPPLVLAARLSYEQARLSAIPGEAHPLRSCEDLISFAGDIEVGRTSSCEILTFPQNWSLGRQGRSVTHLEIRLAELAVDDEQLASPISIDLAL